MFTPLTTLLAAGLATTALVAPTPEAAAAFKAPAPCDFISLAAAGKMALSDNDFADATALAKRNIGGVRMSDGKDFTGHVWYGIYPLNTCIDLRDYAGNLLSFRPDEGTECLVMQGRCDGNDEFADVVHNSTNIGDLSEYFWIGNVSSYICLTE